MDPLKLEKAHHRLLREIERDAKETELWTGRKRFSERTMTAMAVVPRHKFMLPGDEAVAYVNRPQAIGHGQTISQPYIVALMTDFLDLTGSEKVLEIGSGSGYQSAVLTQVADQVFTIEIIKELAQSAAQSLDRLGCERNRVRHGDGFLGWLEEAPFDAIMVTAAPESIPQALVDQLKPGGRMIIPIGRAHDRQTLILVVKDASGQTTTDSVLPVSFVPMVRGKKRN